MPRRKEILNAKAQSRKEKNLTQSRQDAKPQGKTERESAKSQRKTQHKAAKARRRKELI
jgi:hypothetical protein